MALGIPSKFWEYADNDATVAKSRRPVFCKVCVIATDEEGNPTFKKLSRKDRLNSHFLSKHHDRLPARSLLNFGFNRGFLGASATPSTLAHQDIVVAMAGTPDVAAARSAQPGIANVGSHNNQPPAETACPLSTPGASTFYCRTCGAWQGDANIHADNRQPFGQQLRQAVNSAISACNTAGV